MLNVRDVSFAYARQDGPRVLDRVSLTVPAGKVLGLLGPNGSGKTTLLKLLAGVLRPDRGEITLDGRALDAWPRRELAKRIAVVPQETQTAFEYRVLDIVLMGRYPHLGMFELERADDVAVARQALDRTGTLPLEARHFGALSGGEKQRVVIAAALAQASDFLLLDEPTTALDVGYQLEIASLLRRLNAEHGMTMVISTHDLNLAAAICDEVVLLRAGQVLAHGNVEQVVTPDFIRRLYGVDADVEFHARAGHVTVVPIARAH
jgi:iron complex transport system ATP-binding protein